jgi:hypothetical protein
VGGACDIGAIEVGLSIDSISPQNTTTAGGVQVAILGGGFDDGVTIKVDGVQMTQGTGACANPPGDRCRVFTTVAHAAGTVAVVLTNPDGKTATGQYTFGTPNAAPQPKPPAGGNGNPAPQPNPRPSGATDPNQPDPAPPKRP